MGRDVTLPLLPAMLAPAQRFSGDAKFLLAVVLALTALGLFAVALHL